MTIARCKHLRLDVTPYYHCVTRCVRCAFICGRDKVSGKDFSHRRAWIEKHLLLLSEVFCIDVAGYAILSNHYHVVVRVDQERASALPDLEVIERWHRIYKGPEIIRQYLAEESLSESELQEVADIIAQWREQLTNISRFMGHLNESIARRANKEDECKGRFWESRFKMQAILDFEALLQTLIYVDLNPVRAGMAKTPESSLFTSVHRRLRAKFSGLLPFVSSALDKIALNTISFKEIPITFKDYLELLDYTGRQLRRGKRGAIDNAEPAILDRLGYTSRSWSKAQTPSMSRMARAVVNKVSVKKYCEAIGQRWVWQPSM